MQELTEHHSLILSEQPSELPSGCKPGMVLTERHKFALVDRRNYSHSLRNCRKSFVNTFEDFVGPDSVDKLDDVNSVVAEFRC